MHASKEDINVIVAACYCAELTWLRFEGVKWDS